MKKLILTNFGVNILTLLVQFILLIFTNRILEPEGRGLIASLISWNTLYFTFGYLSLHIAIINLVPKKDSDISEFLGSSILSSILLGSSVFIVAYTLYFIFPYWFGEIPFEYYFIFLLVLPIMIMQSNLMSLLQMSGQLKQYNLHGFLYAIFQLCFTLCIIFLDYYSIEAAVYIFGLNYLFSLLLAWYFIFLNHKKIKFSLSHFFKMIQVGVKAHISSIATFFASSVDILMINSMLGKREAGLYFLAVMISKTLLIVPRSVQTIFYHHVSKKDGDDRNKDVFMATRITVFFMLISVFLLIVFSKLLVFILGGENFYDSIWILVILAPGYIFLSVPMILATIWNNIGIFKYLNIFNTLMIVLVVLLNYILIPKFGIYGAAIGTVLTYLYLLLVHLFFTKKFLKHNNILDILIINKQDFILIQNTIKKKFNKD